MPFSLLSLETLDYLTTLTSMDSLYLLLLLLIPLIPLLFLLVLCFLVRPKSVKIPIKNRHVFITGGSSGIGLCIARQAAAEGAKVSILARNLAKLEEARDTIRLATGVEVGIFSADVRDAEAVARAVEEAGPVDVLVCNQGIFTPKELELQDISEIRLMMEVNVMGTFHMIKAALPAMKRRAKETGVPASIALVSSQAGQVRFLSIIDCFSLHLGINLVEVISFFFPAATWVGLGFFLLLLFAAYGHSSNFITIGISSFCSQHNYHMNMCLGILPPQLNCSAA